VTSITELPGQSYIEAGTIDLATGSVEVSVTAGENVDAVTYTNALVTGYIEVCKQAVATSGLTGTFSFNVSGEDGFMQTVSTPVGNCTTPIEVPAGTVTTTEAGTNLYVTGIGATFNGYGNAIVGTPDLTTGVATSTVNASADASNQTDITYTDNVVSLKVCKVWDPAGTEPGGASTTFPFTETAAANSAPGPVPTVAPFTLLAGTAAAPYCSAPVAYRPGTEVTITEGAVAGTKVETIANTGAYSVVPDTLSTLNGTETIIVGTPTTSTSGPTDEAIVTFTDEVAAPGQLKICKFAGTVAPVGTVFNFTVTDGGVSTPAAVTLGQCVVVGLYAFNSVATVTETGSTGNAASAITTVPTYVNENVGGVATATTEPVIVPGSVNLGSVGTSSSVSVLIGEGSNVPAEGGLGGTTTYVDFTDIDPPAVSGGSPVSVSNPGVNAGTTTASSSSAAVSVASSIAAVSTSAKTVPAAKPLTAKEKKALLIADEKSLAKVEAAIVKAQVKVAKTHGVAHKAAALKLAALKLEAKSLKAKIKVLK
jgi:hypothetical protein